ncbi:hypothetical protein N7470_009690 [Penicillium chermesinum]|nr:hypothetical protein N7470_009690 [Penicillium chermesinum]
MALANDPRHVASLMLSWNSLELVSITTLQTLWAGYGKICGLTVRATTAEAAEHLSQLCGVDTGAVGSTYPLILKLISPPKQKLDHDNPTQNEGHLRKILSYEVEQYFYTEVVPLLGDDIAVAKCLSSTRNMKGKEGEAELEGLTATIMVDLRPKYPIAGEKRGVLNHTQVHGALEWLASFHRRSWDLNLLQNGLDPYVLPPIEEYLRRQDPEKTPGSSLWLNGGYTYLATRRTEFASLQADNSEWSFAFGSPLTPDSQAPVADEIASFLTPWGESRLVESYIHGDVKSENLFTSTEGNKVAFFDFQYVGLGLGVCDLAKLFTCSVPLELLTDHPEPLPDQLEMCEPEARLLKRYQTRLLRGEGASFL